MEGLASCAGLWREHPSIPHQGDEEGTAIYLISI